MESIENCSKRNVSAKSTLDEIYPGIQPSEVKKLVAFAQYLQAASAGGAVLKISHEVIDEGR